MSAQLSAPVIERQEGKPMSKLGCHLLLVEDRRDDVELALLALQKAGLDTNVVVAKDGVEALEYLLASEEAADGARPLPKAVLLDINLPRLNGIDVLRAVRSDERTRNLPVVMLTTSALHSDVDACYTSGVNGYVQKPVDFDEFADAIRRLAEYWLRRNVLPASA